MDTIVLCPQCARGLRVPEAHLGKRVKCPGCGTIVRTEKPTEDGANAAGAVIARPTAPANRDHARAAHGPIRSAAGDPPIEPWEFRIKAVADTDAMLKGVYRTRVVADGLELWKDKSLAMRIPLGTPAVAKKPGLVIVELGDREVTLGIAQITFYQMRLANELVEYLQRRRWSLDRSDYAMPWFLTLAVCLPFGIGAIGMMGGALGGAIGGGFVGGLIAGNLSIARKENWALGARVVACMALNVVGYCVFGVLAVLATMGPPPIRQGPAAPHAAAPAGVVPGGPGRDVGRRPPAQRPEPPATELGRIVDPAGDCQVRLAGNSVIIDVPGTVHNLMVSPQQALAPRLLRPVDGDLTAQVFVAETNPPADPPAASSHIAFHGAGLLLWHDENDFIRLEQAAFVRNGQRTDYILFELHQAGRPVDSQGTAYSGGPVRLRLERRGSQVHGSFSTDGHAWRPLRPKPFDAASAEVGVAAVNTASLPFHARFDELAVTSH